VNDAGDPRSRPSIERALDAPQRWALRLPWPPNARIAIKGVFGFLKQILRSRAHGLRASRTPRG
jgi:hypothetical protein